VKMPAVDDEAGGEAANPNSVVAQYQTTRLRSFMMSYKR